MKMIEGFEALMDPLESRYLNIKGSTHEQLMFSVEKESLVLNLLEVILILFPKKGT